MSSVLFSTLVPLQLKVSFLGKLIILLAKLRTSILLFR